MMRDRQHVIAVDAIVLIYAHWGETDLHRAASRELTTLAEGDEPWAWGGFAN